MFINSLFTFEQNRIPNTETRTAVDGFRKRGIYPNQQEHQQNFLVRYIFCNSQIQDGVRFGPVSPLQESFVSSQSNDSHSR